MQDILTQFQDQNIKISELSMTKYQHVMNSDKSTSLIPVLP